MAKCQIKTTKSATAADHSAQLLLLWFTFEFSADGTLEGLKNLHTDGIVTGDIDHN